MGSKTMKIVYDENGGTKEVPVPERECMLWALTPTQAEQVAKGVRAVSKAYDGMIMDTEFCIDSKGMRAPKHAGMKNWPCIPTPSSCAAAKWSPRPPLPPRYC